jgi:tetratricopeptide (TPR) repeat protein
MRAIEKMLERVKTAKDISETDHFLALLYLGEVLTKVVVSGLVASLLDDRERHRYRQLHKLVRADGLGTWVEVLDEIITGPTSHHLAPGAKKYQAEISQKFAKGSWQHAAVTEIGDILKELNPAMSDVGSKTSIRTWFSDLVQLRNKTRGHGAPPADFFRKHSQSLEKSMMQVLENLEIFKCPWGYVHRNISGKYRIIRLNDNVAAFDHLKTGEAQKQPPLNDGVYIYLDRPLPVELIHTDIDCNDFFFPNGAFSGKSYELISYITDNRLLQSAEKYTRPASELPPSETEGEGQLEAIGETLTNIPPCPQGYIRRPTLESELTKILDDDRNPVITLVGRGGTGKTSIALSVLHDICKVKKYGLVLWFSARDIDLMPHGPKGVKPKILTEKELAQEYCDLTGITSAIKASDAFEAALTKSPFRENILFVFDNFETVRNPIDVYNWINERIRLPNKALITTRHREFKGDHDIRIQGMTETEASELITTTAQKLGIQQLLTDEYMEALFKESDGHPYVMKVLLGEVAKAGSLVKVERIMAGKEDVLDALFERTFSSLSPTAKRVFLTLCSWKTLIPQLAIEAVLMRPQNEKMDVSAAIDELFRSSFIEVSEAQEDNGNETLFLNVPLVTSVFGQRKLATSSMKTAIEHDVEMLRLFGPTQKSGIKHGLDPKVRKVFEHVAREVSSGAAIKDYEPMLEFICRSHPFSWLRLSSLYEEINNLEKAKEALQRFLEREENPLHKRTAWEKIVHICDATGDTEGSTHATLELCKIKDIDYSVISNSANKINTIFKSLNAAERKPIAQSLIGAMEERGTEANANDCSRLAWLCLNIGDESRAKKWARAGLEIDPYNPHCQSLAERFG